MHLHHRSLACLLVVAALVCPAFAATLDLWTAASANDIAALRDSVKAGKAVDARDASGRTPLMQAAAAAQFGALRELLRLGANPDLKTAAGKTALDLVPEYEDESRPCALLLRAATFFRANARPPAGRPARPHLVLLFEPTVNYLHPAIKPAYYVNTAELNGRAGTDDDGNGFVDDVYGWNLAMDKPHAINPLQFQFYLESRELLARLFKLYNDYQQDKITEAEFKQGTSGYGNPLAQIFGQSAGFSDGDFLEKAIALSHGSHVAGIVLEHSRGAALLHTLSWQAFGASKDMLPPDELNAIARNSADVGAFLGGVRQKLLGQALATGRRLSDYVRTTGAGVVNMSMGSSYGMMAAQAEQLAIAYLQGSGQQIAPEQVADFRDFLRLAAFEFYTATAVQFLLPMVENPDVLFVIAAGNDSTDNDSSFQAPAYLSRFAANALAVGAVDRKNQPTDFSNYGRLSVDLGAPGKDIMSTVIPEASVMMDGTSMAAPAVAGAAAWLRRQRPDLTAAELKKLILCSGTDVASLARHFATGAALDESHLFKFADADATARAEAYALATIAAALLDASAYPEHLADADELSRTALAIAPQSSEAWRARAAYFDIKGEPQQALEPIERAVQLDPASWRAWNSRAIIHYNLGDLPAAVASSERSVRAADAAGAPAPNRISPRLYLARLQLRQNQRDAAAATVRAIRQIDPDFKLDANLAGLLP